nr:phage tail protein [Lentibacter algarum]
MVEGYAVGQVEEARVSLQPLMLAYGFDAVERDGILVFLMRDGQKDHALEARAVALSEELDADVERLRASDAELMGRVRLHFIQSGADFETVTEEAVLPDEASQAVAASELPLVMRRGAGLQIVERWLSEARVGRDTLRFALPPSKLDVAAGDVLRLQFDGIEQLLRVDRVEIGKEQIVEAVRIASEAYNPVDMAEDTPLMSGFTPALPIFPLFLDLPLMRGDEVPHAPHLAVSA